MLADRYLLAVTSTNLGTIAKVSIRASRKDANNSLKKLQKDGLSEDLEKDAETEVQNMTDNFGKKVESLIMVKEKDIMTI